ncbi:hypothetical protein HHI36_002176 [Cryptolaemus montrouzieri]|uniref:Uncharacterized protein n=1 Tax=Cryptolaemus montrouzieri TaxID=559131 RepID=A0ABD2PAJ3_9CUCU
MKVNTTNGSFSRSSSTRSRKPTAILPKSSYSSPTPSSAPRSPSLNYQCLVDPDPATQLYRQSVGPKSPSYIEPKSPSYPKSPNERIGSISPKVHLSSPVRVDSRNDSSRVFDFTNSAGGTPKSPRSPRSFKYDGDITHIDSSSNDSFNFNLQSPPKQRPSKLYSRKQYQSSKSDSSNSKSSLEYHSTKKHPTGDYQDIEYKVCHSLDSDSQSEFRTASGYRYSVSSSMHSSFKDKSGKPRCNIRTNPVYDERYSSSKSINECKQTAARPIQRCRKSTSDLTDLTDDAVNTTTTSLSRPSSPRRKGSVKGGLAYLASRRGSRDSVASNMSNVSNEDIGPLNFQNTARGRQRRTSNFLELPERLQENKINHNCTPGTSAVDLGTFNDLEDVILSSLDLSKAFHCANRGIISERLWYCGQREYLIFAGYTYEKSTRSLNVKEKGRLAKILPGNLGTRYWDPLVLSSTYDELDHVSCETAKVVVARPS